MKIIVQLLFQLSIEPGIEETIAKPFITDSTRTDRGGHYLR